MAKITLIDSTINPVPIISQSAAICKDGGTEDYQANELRLKFLLSAKHYAVLRFAYATFKIEDISLVCSHQLVRIAHAGILQKSYRSCPIPLDMSDRFMQYPFLDPNSDGYNLVAVALNHAKAAYLKLIDDGIEPEDARYILPQGVTTELIITGNFQMWKHFLNLRLSKYAHWEIRNVAEKVKAELAIIAPTIFGIDDIVA